ncbi:GSCFA domain-containing protein [Paracoccus alkanivorans]|uniref:GSCFA family protein n=1 Tax=Paracoccus alkanivorans TaxID=2116655 RepID=A0A3M0N192_9RHOB|nr:GSCFA domain-containing protein [Paracoccus alkanivorans]RMC37477.1 GSCFA family protein [Paracoccus alkanivorans]
MNPYESQPAKAFWAQAVGRRSMFDIDELTVPKFRLLPRHRVSTYGSCFAQHFGRALVSRGMSWLQTEMPPKRLSDESRKRFNYEVFSSRTGNIYTTPLLLQWLKWATGEAKMPDEIWEKDGRFFDPFRPAVEPSGFASVKELRASQAITLEAFRRSVTESDVFVFTLGLTERWVNKQGYEYPVCPGTLAGTFNPEDHIFENLEYNQVLKSLRQALKIMRKMNRKLRVILTVSPVPLTATASDKHVLVATMHSKSVLRAVAGQLAKSVRFVDYFPSYEIINSPAFKGAFFEPNMRSVHQEGVNFVMSSFFKCQEEKFGKAPPKRRHRKIKQSKVDVVCEEELLGAFSST